MSLLSAVGAALFAAGVGAGWWACRDRDARARAESLAQELEAALREHETYREHVEKHFGQTSDLFRDLTRQYAAVYAHLAEGARDLCQAQPALGRGLDFPGLAALAPDSSANGAPAELARPARS